MTKDTAPAEGRRRRHAKSSNGWHKLLIVLALLVVLAGASLFISARRTAERSSVPTSSEPSTSSPSNHPGPAELTGARCPLSDLPPPNGSVPARPALAIKVDNYPAARPQIGLDHADIVFEEPVEGGITRFVAVFQCQAPPRVGPVRSARLIDIKILGQLGKPIFAYAGAINPILRAISRARVVNENLIDLPTVLERSSSRQPPYNAYVDTAALWKLHENDHTIPTPLFTYSSTVPSGSKANYVHIPFSTYSEETWRYDPATQQYLLYYSGSRAMLQSGRQISATNIVIQKVHVFYGPYVENSFGALEVQAHLITKGPLEVLRNGVVIKGTWERQSLTSPTRLVASNGQTIPLSPGRTWVDLVPSAIKVTIGQGGS
ncbi:MAG: DUF3048 domain-containing protein [Actinobacteria bacterium]|nr:DUF3048 domain-containing protein [Actinomycetota bacterium]